MATRSLEETLRTPMEVGHRYDAVYEVSSLFPGTFNFIANRLQEQAWDEIPKHDCTPLMFQRDQSSRTITITFRYDGPPAGATRPKSPVLLAIVIAALTLALLLAAAVTLREVRLLTTDGTDAGGGGGGGGFSIGLILGIAGVLALLYYLSKRKS